MKKNKKIIVAIICTLIILIGIFAGKRYSDNKHYKNLVKDGEVSIKQDNLDKASELFNEASKYKKNKEVNEKLELIKSINKSKEKYNVAGSKFDKKQYLESIKDYKEVSSNDKKRFPEAQFKIVESYINTSNFEQAEQHIESVREKINKDKLDDIYKMLYCKKANISIKSDPNKAVQLYQKAGKYGLDLKKEKNYVNLLFKLASNIFNRTRTGIGDVECYMGNFDSENSYDNVLVTKNAGGSNGYHICCVYVIRDGKYREIFNSEVNKYDIGWDFKLKDDYKVLFTSNISSEKYEIDISKNDFANTSGEYYLSKENQGPLWVVKDFDKDGVSEIQCKIKANGNCHGDTIARVASYYKYNLDKKKWDFKNYEVVDSPYPFKRIK